jgi:hypothetical protein
VHAIVRAPSALASRPTAARTVADPAALVCVHDSVVEPLDDVPAELGPTASKATATGYRLPRAVRRLDSPQQFAGQLIAGDRGDTRVRGDRHTDRDELSDVRHHAEPGVPVCVTVIGRSADRVVVKVVSEPVASRPAIVAPVAAITGEIFG